MSSEVNWVGGNATNSNIGGTGNRISLHSQGPDERALRQILDLIAQVRREASSRPGDDPARDGLLDDLDGLEKDLQTPDRDQVDTRMTRLTRWAKVLGMAGTVTALATAVKNLFS